MELTFKIIAIASPFIAAILTYFLAIKKTRKEVDIEKERVLNKVLADLLNARFTISKISLLDELSNAKEDTIFPTEQLPQLLLSSGTIDLQHFEELENSIAELKEYDAISYYYLEGIGSDFHLLHNKYLSPILNAQSIDPRSFEGKNPMFKLVNDTATSLEENIDEISKMLSKRIKQKSVEIIDKIKTKTDVNELIDEVEQFYFEWMSPYLSPNKLLSFDDFKQYSKTEEFQQILQIQLAVAKSGNIQGFVDLVENNPNASIEDMVNLMNNNYESN